MEFFQWFHDYLNSAKECYEADKKNGNYQRFPILIAHYSVLESLASVFCDEKESGARFKSLILKYGNWPEANYVSIPLIARFCDENISDGAKRILQFVCNAMPPRHDSRIRVIEEIDVLMSRITDACAVNEDIALYNSKNKQTKKLEHFRHVSLLWQHRNAVIHNLRDIGGSSICETDKPHYIWTHIGTQPNFYDLTYPVAFLSELCNNVLKNIEVKMIDEEKDPFQLYPLTDWFSI